MQPTPKNEHSYIQRKQDRITSRGLKNRDLAKRALLQESLGLVVLIELEFRDGEVNSIVFSSNKGLEGTEVSSVSVQCLHIS